MPHRWDECQLFHICVDCSSCVRFMLRENGCVLIFEEKTYFFDIVRLFLSVASSNIFDLFNCITLSTSLAISLEDYISVLSAHGVPSYLIKVVSNTLHNCFGSVLQNIWLVPFLCFP